MNTHETDVNDSTSSARVDANRRNAQLSTGPRTEEGKARVSQNATRSGWFSRDLRVPEGKIELYLEFEQAWRDELDPAGLAELETFNDFLRSSWHKREVIEALNATDISFLDDESPADARKLDRLHRYLRDFERRAARALRDLRALQTARARQEKERQKAESESQQKQTQPPRGKTPPTGIPEDVLRTLYIMEIESNYMNARYRAHKAGIFDPSADTLGATSGGIGR